MKAGLLDQLKCCLSACLPAASWMRLSPCCSAPSPCSLMAQVFKTPVCLITLIIDDRVWFKVKPAHLPTACHARHGQISLSHCLPYALDCHGMSQLHCCLRDTNGHEMSCDSLSGTDMHAAEQSKVSCSALSIAHPEAQSI